MADRIEKSAQDQKAARTSESRHSDRKAERGDPEALDSGDTERPAESRPRGKTEDPDRTL
ncbi:MAG: hypothetical protein JO306_16575 [Gemmatimonadetes bacterium]|nr:hypothetical protein [Gemmatimonadota bacterium]